MRRHQVLASLTVAFFSPCPCMQISDGTLSEAFRAERGQAERGDQTVGELLTTSGSQEKQQVKSVKLSNEVVGGAYFGGVIGAFMGYYLYGEVLPAAAYGLILGFGGGGLIGELIDMYENWHPHLNVESESADSVELPSPLSLKMHVLAKKVVAIETHHRLNSSLNESEKMNATAAEQAAKDIAAHINEYHNGNTELNETAMKELHKVVSTSKASDYLSAEAAKLNGGLLTAGDLADLHGERSEEIGVGETQEGGERIHYQGDMVPENETQLTLFRTMRSSRLGSKRWVAAGRPWTGGVVKYCFSPDVGEAVRDIFVAATRQFEKATTCLQFFDVGYKSGNSYTDMSQNSCREAPAIFVTSNPGHGCYSYVGMINKPGQILQLQDPGCISIGTATHELGHALGHAHEQSRPDRDQHVQVVWGNVQPGMEHNFDIVGGAFTGNPYDHMSVMHYDAYSFSTQGKKAPTIIDVSGRPNHDMGQRAGLAHYDVYQTIEMYKDEAAGCEEHQLAGYGCVDIHDDNGNAICDGLTSCSGDSIELCCACGGGAAVQCYKDQPCPTVAKLPNPSQADCLKETTSLFPGQQCVVQNICNFAVKWKCSSGCTQTSPAAGHHVFSCGSSVETDICSNPLGCTVWK